MLDGWTWPAGKAEVENKNVGDGQERVDACQEIR